MNHVVDKIGNFTIVSIYLLVYSFLQDNSEYKAIKEDNEDECVIFESINDNINTECNEFGIKITSELYSKAYLLLLHDYDKDSNDNNNTNIFYESRKYD